MLPLLMKEANQLTEILRSLKPQGPEGFEGLVALLLEKLTGQRFFLAHAGPQEGRDMSTGGYGATWIAVEAKHFQPKSSFKVRDLLGELLQLPDGLELWVLASTRRISDQIISVLQEKALARGIAVETLDAPPERLGDLPVLCAAYEEIVTTFLADSKAAQQPRRLLQAIRRHPDFKSARDALRERFRTGSIGYSQTQESSLAYLRSTFASPHSSRARLGQSITVLGKEGRRGVDG